ncbi:MAG: pirin family protein [Spirochaetota bacterium]
MNTRKVKKIFTERPTVEGAGVKLKRVFATAEIPQFDPFLMLDHFGSSNPDDYVAGFPWHPHRGIETVTYMIEGEVEHGDSLGNSGKIKSGDIQWMTAGSGIIHQEMPRPYIGTMKGLQLWVNLPKAEKMSEPRYRDLNAGSVPEINHAKGISVKIISGQYNGTPGAAQDITGNPDYFDITLEPGVFFEFNISQEFNAFAFVLEGKGDFDDEGRKCSEGQGALFGSGNKISIAAADSKRLRFILVSGKPLNEPIAWGGPIVMNTQAELRTAFEELDNGTFIKAGIPANKKIKPIKDFYKG